MRRAWSADWRGPPRAGAACIVVVVVLGLSATGCDSGPQPEAAALPPAATEEHEGCCSVSGVAVRTDWRAPESRKTLPNLELSYVDQDGRRGVVKDLMGRFVVLTFFYTRCDNAYKCSAAVTRLAELQGALAKEGLDGDVRLIAVTYEPGYDSPDRLKRYGVNRGLEFGDGATAIQVDSLRSKSLLGDLDVPVSFHDGWVNTHGVQLSILDREGRLARQYHTVMWDVPSVLADLKVLKRGG